MTPSRLIRRAASAHVLHRVRRPGSVAALALALLLSACAGPPVTQQAFDAHQARFAVAQPHLQQMVARPDGGRLAVREFNPGQRGRSPTLVLMHGFPDNQHLYDALIPLLAQRHHVVSFDFLGWGGSDKPATAVYDVASQRADLDAVVAHLALQQVVPVLHDMSGPVGIDWVLDNPQRSRALVLLNTYYNASPALQAPPAIEVFASKGWLRDLRVWGAGRAAGVFQSGVQSQMSDFFADEAARAAWVPVLAHGAPAIRPAFFSATSVLWQEIAARDGRRAQMQQSPVPVLVAFGRHDPYLNPQVAQALADQFTGARVSLLDAGHYVQLDRPAELASLIDQLLAKP
ncbi:alpha/beta fold hydrolase [Pseudaquabacterium pictum]|uniref:alpha/beta fold hydrolase n=1 Tax=Pseudaquabacterium pictum TaxID=2315236 RepID=UPI0010F800B4|nr:alpha/beta hydrolase [Rubrivivax pictus]